MLNETYRGMLAHKSVIRETFMYGKQRAATAPYVASSKALSAT